MNPSQCREYQIKSLLNWKNHPKNPVTNEKECEYYEVDDVLNTNFEKFSKDLECILVNPPWSSKSQKFEFSKFVRKFS